MPKRDDDDIREVFARLRLRARALRNAGDGRNRFRQAALGSVVGGVGLFILLGGFREGELAGPSRRTGRAAAYGGIASISGGAVPFFLGLALAGLGGSFVRGAFNSREAPLGEGSQNGCEVCGEYAGLWDGEDGQPIARCDQHAPKRRLS
jgi:hypothetical protein